MKQGLPWSLCHQQSLSIIPYRPFLGRRFVVVSANVAPSTAEGEKLTGRERRQRRNEARESKATNWKEEVEEMLIQNSKKKPMTLKEKLNFDTLADLGPRWWILNISRPANTPGLLAKLLLRDHPAVQFRIFNPMTRFQRKLKSGKISVKSKPLYPGNMFIRIVLNRELHDYIRQCPGVWGFVGDEVGNTKFQAVRPRPVPEHQMETAFKRTKEEQEIADKAFEEEQQKDDMTSNVDSKPKRRSRKKSDLPARGSTVRIMSGPFAEFSGSVKTVNRKTGKATVGVVVFGKESLVNVDVSEIVAETS